jgi:alpha-L-fucosidase
MTRRWRLGLVTAIGAVSLLGIVADARQMVGADANESKAPAEAVARWRQLKFGLFIHWGPVSLKGTEIGWSRGAGVPIEEYDNLYKRFNPVQFNGDQWVKVAQDAGMKYVTLTTKHHDGFCLFDTKQGDYNIMHSPFGRDVVKELSAACRNHGMPFGTYYSVCDWHHPDFPHGSPGGESLKPHPNLDRYEHYLTGQVEELIRNYGPLLTIWFDVAQDFDNERGRRVTDRVRSLQPDILINNRIVLANDYDTPEQTVGRAIKADRPWETCMTLCNQWSWKPDDEMKSLKQCLQTLVKVVCGDGNLLFNVGPMPDGRIEPRQVERLREMGQWLAKYGESIYATRGGPFPRGTWGGSTYKDNVVYLHILDPNLDPVSLLPIDRKIVGHRVLTGGAAEVHQDDKAITVSVAKADRQPIDTIVALTLDGPAAGVKPRNLPASVASGKKATASNVWHNVVAQFGPDKAFDDDAETRWATDEGTKKAWLEVDLGTSQKIDRALIVEEIGSRVQRFEIQVKQDESWKTVARGTTIDPEHEITFDPVVAQHVRLNILEATEGPTISEFQLFAPMSPR